MIKYEVEGRFIKTLELDGEMEEVIDEIVSLCTLTYCKLHEEVSEEASQLFKMVLEELGEEHDLIKSDLECEQLGLIKAKPQTDGTLN